MWCRFPCLVEVCLPRYLMALAALEGPLEMTQEEAFGQLQRAADLEGQLDGSGAAEPSGDARGRAGERLLGSSFGY